MKRFIFGTLLFVLFPLSAFAIIDSNSNGLSDLWEMKFNNGELFTSIDPKADPDNDGWTNEQEAIMGTNPFEANSPDGFICPEITYRPECWLDLDENGIPERYPDTVIISWPIIAGKQYTLLYSPDLTAGSWTTVEQASTDVAAVRTYSIPLTQQDGSIPDRGFWRVTADDLDSDGDGITDAEEYALGCSPFIQDSDGDGLPDDWEMLHFGDLTSSDGTQNRDGDWLTDLEEYQNGTDPTVNDDMDLDGWLDRDKSKLIIMGLNNGIKLPTDILPWGDLDGDGLANALEVSLGTNPLSALDPAVPSYTPIIKLEPGQFSVTGSTAVWANLGRLGGRFTSEAGVPVLTVKAGMQAVEISNAAGWMVGPRVAPWLNGSGNRTIVAWVFNPTAASGEDDVLFSWGGGSLGAPRPSLFSCRYSSNTTKGALFLSGSASEGRGWGTSQPTTGSWSFVVYRYDNRSGSLLTMRDFSVGTLEHNVFLQTGVFDSNSRPYPFVLGGENKGDGTRVSTLINSLCIGEMQVFDQALPMSYIINSLYEPSRASFGHTTPLVDTDGDGLPDLFETSAGLNPASSDTDQDGISDGAEFEAGTDAKDFYNGQPHYVTITGGDNQWTWAGSEITAPIRFRVTDINGTAISGAPADITVLPIAAPNGLIRLYPTGSPLNSSISTRTDSNGNISLFFKANQ